MSEQEPASLTVPVSESGPATASAPALVEPSPAPSPEKRRFFVPPRVLALGLSAVLLVTIVTVGVLLAKKQLRKEDAAPAIEEAAPTVTLDIPADEEPALAGGTAPDKIFNDAGESAKKGLEAFTHAAPSVPGAINELPPAPDAAGNAGLQDAAKEAAKLLKPNATDEIDLSGPDQGAALDSLERAAAADAAGSFAIAPGASNLHASVLSNDFAGLAKAMNSGAAEIAGTKAQAAPDASLDRFNDDMRRMQQGQLGDRAGAALALASLSEKLRTGAPYRAELVAYDARGGVGLGEAVAFFADSGMPTPSSLADEFPALRNAALALARRERAGDGVGRIGSEIAALIHLRPSKPIEGAGPVAVLSRAEPKVTAGDVTGALAELEGLAGAPRETFADWTRRASALVEAEAAIAAARGALLAGAPGASPQ